ncbi:MAG: hypothetical protein ACOYK8_09815 [Alphaproteobacteria bacterium]
MPLYAAIAFGIICLCWFIGRAIGQRKLLFYVVHLSIMALALAILAYYLELGLPPLLIPAALLASVFLLWLVYKFLANKRKKKNTAHTHPPPPPAPVPITIRESMAILGLDHMTPEAMNKDIIHDAWLRLIQRNHPDAGGSPWLAAQINKAKDVLMDYHK